MDCEEAVRLFDDTINNICNKSIPKKKSGRKAVPWWSDELAQLRRTVRRETSFKITTLHDTQNCLKIYRVARNKYVSAIKKK